MVLMAPLLDLNAEHLIQQAAHLAMAEVVDTAQKPLPCAELRAKPPLSISAGNSAQLVVWQWGEISRCSWCSITNGSIFGLSTN
jgi:hypothetical protein